MHNQIEQIPVASEVEHSAKADYILFDDVTQSLMSAVSERTTALRSDNNELLTGMVQRDAQISQLEQDKEALAEERDASMVREVEQRDRAERNPLTGLYNQEAFAERVNKALHGSRREGEANAKSGIMFFIDLDHLKAWNDILTEPGVNLEILMPMAEIFRDTTRSSDITGHWGGDEFAVFAEGMKKDDARIFAEKLRERINNLDVTNPSDEGPQKLGVSTGYTTIEAGDDYTDAEIRAARAKKYAKVELGRNEIVDYGDIPEGYDFSKLSEKSLTAIENSQKAA